MQKWEYGYLTYAGEMITRKNHFVFRFNGTSVYQCLPEEFTIDKKPLIVLMLLNQQGKEGWEMFAYNDRELTWYFKRPQN